MYIYELNASATTLNQRFSPGETHLIWMFSTEDLQDRFARTVLDKLQPMGWSDITLKRKLYSHDRAEEFTVGPDGLDIKKAFEAALKVGLTWLVFKDPLKP